MRLWLLFFWVPVIPNWSLETKEENNLYISYIPSFSQWCGSGRNRIHLGPWIRIQGYKMKGTAEFNQYPNFWVFVWTWKGSYLQGLGISLKMIISWLLKDALKSIWWFYFLDPDPHSSNLWIWSRIRSILITAFNIHILFHNINRGIGFMFFISCRMF